MRTSEHTYSIAHTRRGSAVALSLVVVTIIAGLAVAFLRITTAATERQANEVENLQAFYLAEAGLAEAFQALRIGRSGKIGSANAPATQSGGVLWVDAVDTPDGQVRLECTALFGPASTSLALVVEPVEIPLGFFSDRDFVVDDVLLVDGFNSEERTYQEEMEALAALREYVLDLTNKIKSRALVRQLKKGSDTAANSVAGRARLSDQEAAELRELWPDMVEAYRAGLIFPKKKQRAGLPTDYTPSGGLLSSNGDVRFKLSRKERVEVLGDVVPGPNDRAEGNKKRVTVSGEIGSRDHDVALPYVDVPRISLKKEVRHDELLPFVISPGTSGYESIEVAADAELVLRGPSTIVIGNLVLEPGATLTLDTRGGDVELYITECMDLQPGSVTTTSSEMPDELTVQVATIGSGKDGAPIKLESTAQFHGTIYSPRTEVYVGSEFEVYGSIVAQKLDLGPGAKLHFDNAGFQGTPIPRLVSWNIVEVPSTARNRRDPFLALGVQRHELPSLADAHDLTGVELEIEYLNGGGATRTYVGPEQDFDWSDVSKVVSLTRDSTRELLQPIDPSVASDDDDDDDDDLEVGTLSGRADVLNAIATLSGQALKQYLTDSLPLSSGEVVAMLDDNSMAGNNLKTLIQSSAPLEEVALAHLARTPSNLSSNDIKNLLLGNSPLSPAVVELVTSAPDSTINLRDKNKILGGK